MWIYSLGITLRRTLQSFSSANIQRRTTTSTTTTTTTTAATAAQASNRGIGIAKVTMKAPGAMLQHCQPPSSSHPTGNNDESDSNNGAQTPPKNPNKKSSLDYVIRTMCAPNRNNRASLMYLLDVSIVIVIIVPPTMFVLFVFARFPISTTTASTCIETRCFFSFSCAHVYAIQIANLI